MNSERIKTIASLVDKEDIVIDIGTDHGYLPIYLKLNNICKDVYASDISENALNYAINNFKKYNLDIKYVVSDGFNNIDYKYNTAVIAGMGTSTILNIINNKKCPNKLIIASNNDLYKLRLNLYKLNYKIIKEIVVYENNHYYVIMKVIKGKDKLPYKYLKYGNSNNKEYYKYLLSKNKEIIKKVPLIKKISLLKDNYILNNIIKKI